MRYEKLERNHAIPTETCTISKPYPIYNYFPLKRTNLFLETFHFTISGFPQRSTRINSKIIRRTNTISGFPEQSTRIHYKIIRRPIHFTAQNPLSPLKSEETGEILSTYGTRMGKAGGGGAYRTPGGSGIPCSWAPSRLKPPWPDGGEDGEAAAKDLEETGGGADVESGDGYIHVSKRMAACFVARNPLKRLAPRCQRLRFYWSEIGRFRCEWKERPRSTQPRGSNGRRLVWWTAWSETRFRVPSVFSFRNWHYLPTRLQVSRVLGMFRCCYGKN